MRFPHLILMSLTKIKIRNPTLLLPLPQIQTLLTRLQRNSIDTQITLFSLIPLIGNETPNLLLLTSHILSPHLAFPFEAETSHTAIGAEEPAGVLIEAFVVGKTARGGVQWRQDLEIMGWVDGTEVQESHLAARGAVAFVDAGPVWWRLRGVDVVCWESDVRDVLHMATVTGAMEGTTNWWGGL